MKSKQAIAQALDDDTIRKHILNDETLYSNCRANYSSDIQMTADLWNYIVKNRAKLVDHISTRLAGGGA